jgi:hypothetical protein
VNGQLLAVVVVAVLAAGYLLGRVRPLYRARDWAYRTIDRSESLPLMYLALAVLAERSLPLLLRRGGPAAPGRVPSPGVGERWRER